MVDEIDMSENDFPVDRELLFLEEKLGPFESMADWQEKHSEDKSDRLGEDGQVLMNRVQRIHMYLAQYDMTADEAVDCLVYSVFEYLGIDGSGRPYTFIQCDSCMKHLPVPDGEVKCQNCGNEQEFDVQ